jgi:hypothetical protein
MWKRKVPYSESETNIKSCNYCTHCNMRGIWIKKCWKLHLELGPKKDKQVMHAPMKQCNKRTYIYMINRVASIVHCHMLYEEALVTMLSG